jgi:PhoH-like ATPase
MAGKRLYLLDTNVLLHDAGSMYRFGENIVALPIGALEELDHFKKDSSERGFSARQVIRDLDQLRSKGSLSQGVPLETGGTLQIIFLGSSKNSLPEQFSINEIDNQILLTALDLKQKGYEVHFVTKDLNARVKADLLGIEAEDYISPDEPQEKHLYKGWVELSVPSIQLKKNEPEELEAFIEEHPLLPNEFVLMSARNNPWNYRIFRYLGGRKFKPVEQPDLRWPVSARNPQQLMALDLLFDPTIKLVNLIGPAGTGKTFLALLAGLYQVLVTDEFRRVLAARPVVPLGPDIGYLPGDIQEKLRSWMQPMYDTVDFLVHASDIGSHVQNAQEMPQRRNKHKHKHGKHNRDYDEAPRRGGMLATLDELAAAGKISLEAITYMRGRSIPYQYILIDEVQNLNPHEVKTLVSRVGEGSKIILAGDPFQIDSPYLDVHSNGLMVTTEKFKGQPLFGCVFLETSERSELSKLATELL